MFYTIYKITNKINDKIYIGKHQTDNLDDDYMGSGKYLKRAIEKYGRENFTKEILHIFESEDEMNAKEVELVSEDFVKRDDNYNLCPGGHGGWGYINLNERNNGFIAYNGTDSHKEVCRRNIEAFNNRMKNDAAYSATMKEKISKKLKEHQKVHGNPFQNKTHTERTKTIMSKKAKSRLSDPTKNPQYGKIWITNGKSSKMIMKETKLPQGWQKGRKILGS